MESISEVTVNGATAVLWRRLPYLLSPQLDIYEKLPRLVSGKRVIEIGFGTGVGVLQYASAAQWVDALEVDTAAVRFAERCFPLQNVQWIEEDVLSVPMPQLSYDLLVMIEVLEHIGDTQTALRNVAALASEALITVPNSLRYRAKNEVLNEHEWTPITFVQALHAHFKDVRLLNYELKETDDLASRETPIIALCS